MNNKYIDYLVSWLQEEVKKAGAKGVVVGISGGVDSAVVAAIAKKAFPNNSIGVVIPINVMGQDKIDAEALIKEIDIKKIEIDLTYAYTAVLNFVTIKSKLALANIKPRLRMIALYAIAQDNNYLVLGTDNAAEWILGYFTKYGDGGVDLLPIVNMTKGEIREAAKILGVPNAIITKKPTAALWPGQTDEDELGFSYDYVDSYLKGKSIPQEIKDKINEIKIKTEHKRKPLPQPKLKPSDVF